MAEACGAAAPAEVPRGAGTGEGPGPVGVGEVPQDGSVHLQPSRPEGENEQSRGATEPLVALLGETAVQVAAAEMGAALCPAGAGPLLVSGGRRTDRAT